ncbi:hypothetical protein DQ353_20015 [Arthrobacter sp. AQ5-05]|uniref:DUF6398 domain-containing protein n=1 Tax=Arthrobacter sp. AQ5-05 TaxID=2184581 RepID=UPI000DCE7B01|nr:DUF6398 domain-containing protein [Arthrobacter sp. AQ5-05]RAX46570.1 hypothetical protein DQ353_20015 [Arthrobacter sp. AQ5-05]
MAELKDPKMPKDVQERGATVIGITDEFCLLHLDAKYAQLCRNVVGKLARKRPSPLLRGDLRIWAGGVIYALASNNFLFDPSQPMHLGAQQLGDLMGVKKATMSNKGTMVRNLLKIGMMDPEFTHPDLMDKNPPAWTLLIDGLPIDVRLLPVEFQRRAFDLGLIPYIPGEESTDE